MILAIPMIYVIYILNDSLFLRPFWKCPEFYAHFYLWNEGVTIFGYAERKKLIA